MAGDLMKKVGKEMKAGGMAVLGAVLLGSMGRCPTVTVMAETMSANTVMPTSIFKENTDSAVSVDFRRIEDDSNERGEITGISNEGSSVWKYITADYSRTELDRINDIGVFEGRYYFVEGGIVKALDLKDGSTIWSNEEFGGCAYGSAFKDDGTLFICGYYGPDLFVVDKDGKTLKKIDSFHKDYMWPHKLEILGDQLAITYSGTPSGTEEILYIDLSDYSLVPGRTSSMPVSGTMGSPVTDSAVENISASSYLEEPQYGLYHGVSNLMDGDLSTAWVESVDGQGEGEAFTLKLNGTYKVSGFTIYAGYQKNEDIYTKNSRPAKMTVMFSDGTRQDVELDDINGPQKITFDTAVNTSSVRLTIQSVYSGTKYQDTAVSEISLF